MSTLYYHNPRCSKSRQGLEILNEKGLDFEIVEYLKTPLKKKNLIQLFENLAISEGQFKDKVIRTKEAAFKELELSKQDLTVDQWAELIIKHPILLERPILNHGNKAIIGRPPEDLLKII
jgi:arsenate reductase